MNWEPRDLEASLQPENMKSEWARRADKVYSRIAWQRGQREKYPDTFQQEMAESSSQDHLESYGTVQGTTSSLPKDKEQ